MIRDSQLSSKLSLSIPTDLLGRSWTIFLQRDAGKVSKRLEAWFDRHFELYPAINIEHKSERTKQFVTLVLGYSVVGLLYQSSASFGLNAFFGKAVLGLVLAFAVNWIYFEIDGGKIHIHAIRRHVVTCPWLSPPHSYPSHIITDAYAQLYSGNHSTFLSSWRLRSLAPLSLALS